MPRSFDERREWYNEMIATLKVGDKVTFFKDQLNGCGTCAEYLLYSLGWNEADHDIKFGILDENCIVTFPHFIDGTKNPAQVPLFFDEIKPYEACIGADNADR